MPWVWRHLAYLGCALVPLLVLCFSLLACGLTAVDFVPPAIPNDQLEYYLEILAFQKAGFQSGYFTCVEVPARAQWSSFGVHGPAFPVIYGTVARICGWGLSSPPWVNAGVLGVCMLVFCLRARLSIRQAAFASLFLASFLPLHLYLLTNLQEPMHYGFAILAAGEIARLVALPQRNLWTNWALPAVVLVLAGMVRPDWGFLLIPLFIVRDRPTNVRGYALAIGKGAAGMVLGLWVFSNYVTAPMPVRHDAFIMNKFATLEFPLKTVLQRTYQNLAQLLLNTTGNSRAGTIVLWQTIGVAAWYSFWSGKKLLNYYRRFSGFVTETASPADAVRTLQFWHLALYFLASLAVYYVGSEGGPRLMSVHALLGFMLAIALFPEISPWDRRLLWALVASSFIALPFVYPSIEQTHERWCNAERRSRIEQCAADFSQHLKFDPSGSRWSNTLLVCGYDDFVLGTPAGIGVSWFERTDQLSFPLRSHYILMPPALAHDARFNIRSLGRAPSWPNLELYENLNLEPSPEPRP